MNPAVTWIYKQLTAGTTVRFPVYTPGGPVLGG